MAGLIAVYLGLGLNSWVEWMDAQHKLVVGVSEYSALGEPGGGMGGLGGPGDT